MDTAGNICPLDARHDLSAFDCGDPSLNSWLRRHALFNQNRNNTKTFVVTAGNGRQVVGFYSLSAATLSRQASLARLLDAASVKHPIPAILLARLGVDQTLQGRGLGKALLKNALQRALSISRQVGVKAVLVHAKPGAVSFYVNAAGFEPSPTDPSHLILPMHEIAGAFDSSA